MKKRASNPKQKGPPLKKSSKKKVSQPKKSQRAPSPPRDTTTLQEYENTFGVHLFEYAAGLNDTAQNIQLMLMKWSDMERLFEKDRLIFEAWTDFFMVDGGKVQGPTDNQEERTEESLQISQTELQEQFRNLPIPPVNFLVPQ